MPYDVALVDSRRRASPHSSQCRPAARDEANRGNELDGLIRWFRFELSMWQLLLEQWERAYRQAHALPNRRVAAQKEEECRRNLAIRQHELWTLAQPTSETKSFDFYHFVNQSAAKESIPEQQHRRLESAPMRPEAEWTSRSLDQHDSTLFSKQHNNIIMRICKNNNNINNIYITTM